MMEPGLIKYTFNDDLYQLRSHVVVLLPVPWESITDAGQQLLARILGSVKIGLAGVQILEASSFRADDLAIYNPETILSFGVPFISSSNKYELITVDDVNIVVADALHELDDTRKKNLWTALKAAFRL